MLKKDLERIFRPLLLPENKAQRYTAIIICFFLLLVVWRACKFWDTPPPIEQYNARVETLLHNQQVSAFRRFEMADSLEQFYEKNNIGFADSDLLPVVKQKRSQILNNQVDWLIDANSELTRNDTSSFETLFQQAQYLQKKADFLHLKVKERSPEIVRIKESLGVLYRNFEVERSEFMRLTHLIDALASADEKIAAANDYLQKYPNAKARKTVLDIRGECALKGCRELLLQNPQRMDYFNQALSKSEQLKTYFTRSSQDSALQVITDSLKIQQGVFLVEWCRKGDMAPARHSVKNSTVARLLDQAAFCGELKKSLYVASFAAELDRLAASKKLRADSAALVYIRQLERTTAQDFNELSNTLADASKMSQSLSAAQARQEAQQLISRLEQQRENLLVTDCEQKLKGIEKLSLYSMNKLVAEYEDKKKKMLTTAAAIGRCETCIATMRNQREKLLDKLLDDEIAKQKKDFKQECIKYLEKQYASCKNASKFADFVSENIEKGKAVEVSGGSKQTFKVLYSIDAKNGKSCQATRHKAFVEFEVFLDNAKGVSSVQSAKSLPKK